MNDTKHALSATLRIAAYVAVGVVGFGVSSACTPAAAKGPGGDEVIAGHVKSIDGADVDLASYRGKVLLVVNVASECGFTPQYEDLQKLYASYKDKGVEVLGFPSNDFGGQEPGDAAAIKKFASETYGVTFPLFDKVHAKGDEQAPLYKTLTTKTPFPGDIEWNFTKFVVAKDGHVVARFPSKVTPMDPTLTAALDTALAK